MSGRFRGSRATRAGGAAVTDRQQSLQWKRSDGFRTAWLVTYKPPNPVRPALHSTAGR